MVRFLAFVSLLAVPPVLAAEAVPKLDIRATCKAEVTSDPQAKSVQDTCVKEETQAENELEKQWADFPAALRERCVRETNIGGAPSYVEVLTCLEVASGNNTQATGATRTNRRPQR